MCIRDSSVHRVHLQMVAYVERHNRTVACPETGLDPLAIRVVDEAARGCAADTCQAILGIVAQRGGAGPRLAPPHAAVLVVTICRAAGRHHAMGLAQDAFRAVAGLCAVSVAAHTGLAGQVARLAALRRIVGVALVIPTTANCGVRRCAGCIVGGEATFQPIKGIVVEALPLRAVVVIGNALDVACQVVGVRQILRRVAAGLTTASSSPL